MSRTRRSGDCTICLENAGPEYPVQGGCGCRGSSGLAHVACRIEAATHMQAAKGFSVWCECGTCNQQYTGLTQFELACAWVRLVAAGGPLSPQRDDVAVVRQRRPSRATPINMERPALSAYDGEAGFACSSLAAALSGLGRHAEAEVLFTHLHAAQKAMFGPNHPRTFAAARSLALGLQAQGKHAEAETVCTDVLAALTQGCGPGHPGSLPFVNTLASQPKPRPFTTKCRLWPCRQLGFASRTPSR
jgi:hypothetical protein